MAWETKSPYAYLEQLKKQPELRGKMYAHQAELPRLPVPDLRNACERYLKAVRPVINGAIPDLSPAERSAMLAATEANVAEFCKPGGRGEELHRRLLEHEEKCKAAGEASWLKRWWLYAAYHADPTPIPVNSNVYCVSRDHPISVIQEVDWVCRAAAMIEHSMIFSRMIDNGDVPVDTAGKRKLCMDQYTRVLRTVRIPGETADHIVTYPPEQSRHVIILVRDHFFALDALEPDLTPRPAAALLPDLEDILAVAETLPPADGIGVFTYEYRPVWAKARARLLEHSATNAASLEAIQSAQSIFIFDENRPTTRQEIGRLALQGDGRNRFFDKTSQLIIFRNGKMGFNAEHSPFDAPPTAHGNMSFTTAMETVEEYIKLHQLRRWGPPQSLLGPPTSAPEPNPAGFPGAGGAPQTPAATAGSRWRLLSFDVPADVRAMQAKAVLTAKHLIQSSQLEFLEYQPYGMEVRGLRACAHAAPRAAPHAARMRGMLVWRAGAQFIRRKARLSPDSYLQMALQLAYYRVYGHFASTYETQQTRAFLHGRTGASCAGAVVARGEPRAEPPGVGCGGRAGAGGQKRAGR